MKRVVKYKGVKLKEEILVAKDGKINRSYYVDDSPLMKPIDHPRNYQEDPENRVRQNWPGGESWHVGAVQYAGVAVSAESPSFEISGLTNGYACWVASDEELLWRLVQTKTYLASIVRDAPETWPVRRIGVSERLLPGSARLTRALQSGHENRPTELLLDLMQETIYEVQYLVNTNRGNQLSTDNPKMSEQDVHATGTLRQSVQHLIELLQEVEKHTDIMLATHNIAVGSPR